MRMLPEDCIAEVLSLTSPEDVCRLSLVSTTFRSASESDKVWCKFLPHDYEDIINRSSPQPPQFTSRKQLYLWLSHNFLIIDSGTKSFSVEKRSCKRCYMLCAKDFYIEWGNTPHYWRWTLYPDSRFGEVAELLNVCWLEIRGKINISLLSSNTTYTAFLVYKLTPGASGFKNMLVNASVGVSGGVSETMTSKVCLKPHTDNNDDDDDNYYDYSDDDYGYDYYNGNGNGDEDKGEDRIDQKVIYPKVRKDGWFEIELGDYLNYIIGDGLGVEENWDLEMSLKEVELGHWKSGLIVQGMEIRPKLDLGT